MACFVCVRFLTQCFLIVFMDFDMLLAARHGFVLSCFCCCMDCPQSLGLGHGLRSVDCWADFLLGVCYGLFILVSWLPCCCMHCDMLLDVRHGLWFVAWCTSWTVYHGFLAARLLHGLWFVAWCVCVCVMDCVSCFLGRCVTCCCIDLICCLV